MISLIRGIVTKFTSRAGKLATFSATGRTEESFKDRVAMQQFGFASALPKGTEALLLKKGQNVYLIASENRKFRIALEEGEAAIYNDKGDNIVLKKKHTIEVNTIGPASKVIVNSISVELGGASVNPQEGVLTGLCPCLAYGSLHVPYSTRVKAKMA
ncbi:MAG TPA: phage baseplate assembly protein [Chitinispirillaceae bacterium]|nr:phage baseplate assembly protein [Chitinispirillaceae bacterium]